VGEREEARDRKKEGRRDRYIWRDRDIYI